MLRSVFTKTLWDRRWGLLGWVTGGFAITTFIVAVYPIVRDNSGLTTLIDELPIEMLSLFGIDPEILTTGYGYLQAQMYTLIGPLLVLVLAIGMGATATAKEERTGTADLLLTTPTLRSSVVLQKTLALVVSITLLVLSIVAALLIGQVTVNLQLSIWGIIGANVGLLVLGTFFGSMAFAIGAWSGMNNLAMGLAAGIAGLTFFLNGMAPLVEGLQGVQGYLPFHWYVAGDPMLNGPGAWLVLLLGGSVLFTTAAVVGFSRRNIGVIPTIRLVPRRRSETGPTTRSRSRLLLSVYGKTVWDRRRSFWWWLLAMGSLAAMTAAFYPLTEQIGGGAFQQLLDAYPPELMAMFGITDTQSLFTGAGLMSTRVYSGIGLIIILAFAIGMGKAALAGEESEGTADLLLTTPQRRSRIVIEKASAMLVLLFGLAVGTGGVVWVSNVVIGLDITLVGLVGATVGMALFAFLFGTLALAVGAWTGRPALAIGAAATAGVVAFLLNGFGLVIDWLEPIRPLSPFYWLQGDTNPLVRALGWQQPLMLAVGLAFVALGAAGFRNRDIGT